MLGGNNGNPVLPDFLNENHLQYQTNLSSHLQLFGNVPAGCTTDPVNYFGNEHLMPMSRPNKRGRGMEDIQRQQNLQISLNYSSIFQEEAHRSARNPNPVSTGLRLSYDDDERNSSVTSASGSMTAPPPMVFSLGDNIHGELNRQKEDFDKYIKIQEENLLKGVRDMNNRHTVSFLASIEEGISKKLKEKDQEIDTMNRKNRELADKIRQVATEAQNWHNRAKQNESIVNVLRNNLQQAMSQGAEQAKEGFGDSEVDNAASYVDPNNYLRAAAGASTLNSRHYQGTKENMICRACKAKDVCILLMPCRHLCLCKDCDMFIRVCPLCHVMKTDSAQVYLS